MRRLVPSALLVLTACAPPPAPATQANSQPTTVTIRLEGDWPHLDVTGRTPGGGIPTDQITSALYDALVLIGPDSQDPTKPKLLPYLATSWDQTPTSITFHLRTDATCPDHTPITASLVKQNADVRLGTPGVATIWDKGPFTTAADDDAHSFTMTFGTPFSDAIYGFLLLLPLASPQIFWFSHGVTFFPGASWSDVRFLRRAGG
jgi:peptide/nickel transport system substrate-binding protein